ncbi:hypothetical protein POTG_01056 [Paenibacillus sp. oral taxon 786 str. D14]|nr:hypothetical protein POTG_01056 [Paenibacillus sp. oral taxon 786 str. D14]
MLGDFNPRTHKECDKSYISIHNVRSISIHALTRSATVVSVVSNDPVGFQSTHSQGVRPIFSQIISGGV